MYRLFNQYKVLTLALMLATDAELTVLPVTDDATAKMQVPLISNQICSCTGSGARFLHSPLLLVTLGV